MRSFLLIAMLAAAVLAAAACGTDPTPTPTPAARPTPTPTPTATPTPPPTPTATPLPPSITVDIGAGAVWRDVDDELYPSERDCIRSALGDDTYQALLDEPALAEGTALTALPLGCLQQANAVIMVVAYLDDRVGGLSPDSENCLRRTFATADFGLLARVSGATDGGAAPDFGAAIGSAIGLAFCLNDEESAAVSVGELIGDPALDFSVAQFVCIVEHVDIQQLLLALAAPDSSADDGGELPAIPIELFQALSECEIELAAPAGEDSA